MSSLTSAEVEVSDPHSELRAYYEEEARRGLRNKPLGDLRVGLRSAFIELLRAEGRSHVADFGAGPGRDCVVFAEAGLDVVGVDLAHANGLLAGHHGVEVVQGSVIQPPFRTRAFDAGWSMSTLMHLPAVEMAEAAAAMAATISPGGPLRVGVWGGDEGEWSDESIEGQRRSFFHRPLDENAEILAVAGEVERAEGWDLGSRGRYQAFLVRVGD